MELWIQLTLLTNLYLVKSKFTFLSKSLLDCKLYIGITTRMHMFVLDFQRS